MQGLDTTVLFIKSKIIQNNLTVCCRQIYKLNNFILNKIENIIFNKDIIPNIIASGKSGASLVLYTMNVLVSCAA